LTFEATDRLVLDQVAAVVEAELLTDPGRAVRYSDLLDRALVAPRLVGCMAPPVPGRRAAALVRLWLVLEEPDAWGDRQFMVFDQHRRSFLLGFLGRSGERALVQGRSGGFFSMLDLLTNGSR
jgi:hypothetical protein